jgi:hypothetical protein
MQQTSPGERGAVLDDPTRQELDDLDALMQRMLALPVNPQEEVSALPTASLPPASFNIHPDFPLAVKQSPRIEQTVVPTLSSSQDAAAPATIVAAAAAGNLIKSTVSMQLPRLAPVAEPGAKADAPPIQNRLPVRHSERSSRTSVWMLPLLCCERMFVMATNLFGPVGRCLQGPRSRMVIGLTGFIMLLAAATWVSLGWMGWTW